jgi:hypothetical protein
MQLYLKGLRFFFILFSFLPIGLAAPLKLEINITLPSCIGSCDGLVDLTVTGGKPGYQYAWSNGLKTEDFSNACAGSGNVTVQDATGNTATIEYTVRDPLPISLDHLIIKQPDPGLSNGSIELNVSGGTLPYRFSKDGLHYSTFNQFSNLGPGLYVISIQDTKGCLVQSSTIELSSDTKSTELISYYRFSRDEETHVLHMYCRIPLAIDLRDLQGRLLVQEGLTKSHDIPLDDLNYGIYILKISDGVKTAFEKIVKTGNHDE